MASARSGPATSGVVKVDEHTAVGAGQVLHPTFVRHRDTDSLPCAMTTMRRGGPALARTRRRRPRRRAHCGRCRTSPAPHVRASPGHGLASVRDDHDETWGPALARTRRRRPRHRAHCGRCRTSPAPHVRASPGHGLASVRDDHDETWGPALARTRRRRPRRRAHCGRCRSSPAPHVRTPLDEKRRQMAARTTMTRASPHCSMRAGPMPCTSRKDSRSVGRALAISAKVRSWQTT